MVQVAFFFEMLFLREGDLNKSPGFGEREGTSLAFWMNRI